MSTLVTDLLLEWSVTVAEQQTEKRVSLGLILAKMAWAEGTQRSDRGQVDAIAINGVEGRFGVNALTVGSSEFAPPLGGIANALLGTVHDLQVLERSQVVLAKTAEPMFEVPLVVCGLQLRMPGQTDCVAGQDPVCSGYKCIPANQAAAVKPLVALVQLVDDPDERAQALSPSEDLDQLLWTLLLVPRIERPHKPGVEAVAACSVRNVRKARQQAGVEMLADGLDREVVPACDGGFCW